MSVEKPLFIPLKRKFFERFESGEKDTEYRPYGPRWNERTCKMGRLVTLSLGYGKQRRLQGWIAGFDVSADATKSRDWIECYGSRHSRAACIRIKLI